MCCKQESVQVYQSEWLKFIEQNLPNMSMRNIWMYEWFGFSNTYVGEAIKLRLKDKYIQEWNADLNMTKTCSMYKLMEATDWIENYLIQLPYHQRRSISRFHCRNNKLPITHGRDVEIVVDEMLLSGVPDLCDRTKIQRCGDLSHLHVPDSIWVFFLLSIFVYSSQYSFLFWIMYLL